MGTIETICGTCLILVQHQAKRKFPGNIMK